MKQIAIIGSGSWGVALAIHLAKNGNKVKIWSFSKEEADLLNNEKKCKFLPNAVIPDNIECRNSYEEVIKDADIILHVTPSKFTRDTVKQYKEFVDVEKQPIVINAIPLHNKTQNRWKSKTRINCPEIPVILFLPQSFTKER